MKLRNMFALGRAVGRNEIRRVETLCNEALAANERDLMALMALADAYWRNQRREDALTLALQALEVEPNQYYALRIVAGVYAERGEHEPAYRYARRLLDADTRHLRPARTVSRILAALAWLPVVRRLKELVDRDERETESSYSEWLHWANGYVRWYESR
jgi:tetratricopeptide (TPR) repeat protein